MVKVLNRALTGWNLYFGSGYLFAPLTSAMSNSINERPGETDGMTTIVTKIHTPSIHRDVVHKSGKIKTTRNVVSTEFDSEDDDEFAPTASPFMPELEVAI